METQPISRQNTCLRRSNRSNKGVSKEIFDPSDISSPKQLTLANHRKMDSDDSEDEMQLKNKANIKHAKHALSEKSVSGGGARSSADSEEDVWCLCRKPHDGRFMISCDVCEEWYHGDCVSVSAQRGRQMEKRGEEYVCPICMENREKAKRALKKSNATFKLEVKQKKFTHDDVTLDPPAEKRKCKEPMSETKPLQGEVAKCRVKWRNCIVSTCQNEALADSVYCSNACILRHATESLGGIKQQSKKLFAEKHSVVESESREERILRKIREASSKGKVAVVSMKTGKILVNASAPQKDDLEVFLKRNPTFQKLRVPKSLKQTMMAKERSAKAVDIRKWDSFKHDGDPGHKPLNKQHSNPYKKLTPVTLRDTKSSEKMIKRKMRRQELEETKTKKRRPESERRHSMDKTTPARLSAGKWDSRSISDEKITLKNDQAALGETEVRKNVQKTLQGILQRRSDNSKDLKMHADSINKLIGKVEDALYELFGGVNAKYKNRYRSMTFNLKDEKNEGLWRKVILGEVAAKRLVKMTAEEMASKELAQWRKHELTQELEMIQELEVAKQAMRPVAKITHKGEIEINEDFSDLAVSHIDSSLEKSTPAVVSPRARKTSETAPETVDFLATDTTAKHRSHLFDLNCMICTGQIKEEDAVKTVESQTVKRSTSIIFSNGANLTPKEESDEDIIKKIKEFSNKVEIITEEDMHKKDNEASGLKENIKDGIKKNDAFSVKTKRTFDDVEINDEYLIPPERSSSLVDTALKRSKFAMAKPSVPKSNPPKPRWSDFLWTGVISMPELSNFRSSAFAVSGDGKEVMNIVPRKLVLDGRIHPKVVWEYLDKVKSFSNKEVCIVQFLASSEEDRAGYTSMLSYFSTRRRFGVVSNQNSQIIKDIYLAPLLDTQNIPKQLLPFKGPGMPANHPSTLLGIIVRSIPETTKNPTIGVESQVAEIVTKAQNKHEESRSDRGVLRALSVSSNEDKALDSQNKADEEEYNPETADFKYIIDEEVLPLVADDEEAYDPEKLVFGDVEASDDEDDDNAPYDPEVDAERLENTEVKALQEKAAYLEKMQRELEMKKAALAKEEMFLQQRTVPVVTKPMKLVSQTLVDPRIAARSHSKQKLPTQQMAESPLQTIFSVLNIDRSSPM